MKYFPLIWASMRRKPVRLTFTLLSVMVAFILFGLLSATQEAFVAGVDLIGNERLLTRHKVSFIQPLPLAYENRIAAVDGIAAVAHGDWLGGYYQEAGNRFVAVAVDEGYIAMYPEIVIPEGQRMAWRKTRTAVVVGKTLAERFGWKVGDQVPLRSAIWRNVHGGNTWEVDIAAIYDSTSRAVDTATMFLHYDYFNEGRTVGRDTVGWYLEKLHDPARASEVADSIDALFANSTARTKTTTEKAFVQGFVAMFGDIGAIVTYVSMAVFFSMLLVTGNTMAHSVRERTGELAVMKAMGFSDRGILGLVLGEAIMITLIGGSLGLLLAWVISKALAGRLAQFLPSFFLTGEALLVGLLCALLFGVASGLWPSWQALRLKVATALRSA